MKRASFSSREELETRFGLGRRLSARLLLLARKGLGMTETVLESAAPRSKVEELLLSDEILDEAERLDSERLMILAARFGLRGSENLEICPDENGARMIAFSEEMLVEGMGKFPDPGAPGGINNALAIQKRESGTIMAGDAGGAFSIEEARGLFTPEEMARLKLATLTSKDPGERVEAMRRFMLSPAAMSDKARLFAGVLIDATSGSQVRAEAVRCLERLGLSGELSDAIRGLFGGRSEQTVFNVERLGMMMAAAGDGERSLIRSVLLELLEESGDMAVQRAAIAVLSASCGGMSDDRNQFDRFMRAVLKRFIAAPSEMRDCARSCLHAMAQSDSASVSEQLWRELNTTQDHDLRSFIMTMITQLSDSPVFTSDLAGAIVEEMIQSRASEQERARLRFGLVRLGEPGVKAILKRLPHLPHAQRPPMIRHLDILCSETDVGSEILNDAIEALIDLLKIGDRSTRRTILESRVCAAAGIELERRARLARTLLENIRDFRLKETVSGVQSTMISLGAPTIAPLLDFLESDCDTMQGDALVEALAEIVVKAEIAGEISEGEVLGAIDFCMGIFDREGHTRGGFTLALSRMCGSCVAGRERFPTLLRRFTDRIWKSPYSYAMLDAMGIAAGSPNCPDAARVELCSRFTNILNMTPPQEIGHRRKTDDGDIYVFGKEIDFDTLIIPAAVRGLERVCVAGNTPEGMRSNIVKSLLTLWEGVAKVRVVWSPAGIDALVHAMSASARSANLPVESRLMLGQALLQFAHQKLNVVRALGDIGAQSADSSGMAAFDLDAGGLLLKEYDNIEMRDNERRQAILNSLVKIAANRSLDAAARTASVKLRGTEQTLGRRLEEFRAKTVQTCFRALREGYPFAREPLEALRDCPALRNDLRDEIAARLTKAFGLVISEDAKP
ncbi:MAG TPA: hypothetical protein PL033_12650 [Candidatus Brocadiia bacterium]|nr:hypothetical protein [Candidatus Brocadiia bacterium]